MAAQSEIVSCKVRLSCAGNPKGNANPGRRANFSPLSLFTWRHAVKGIVNRFNNRKSCGRRQGRSARICIAIPASQTRPADRKPNAQVRRSKERTPDRWGERPGAGVTAEGGRRKLVKTLQTNRETCSVHGGDGEDANLAQLFVGEEGFDFFAGVLVEAVSGFAGDAAQFAFGNAEQQSGPAVRHEFQFLTVHVHRPHAGSRTMASSSTARIMAL